MGVIMYQISSVSPNPPHSSAPLDIRWFQLPNFINKGRQECAASLYIFTSGCFLRSNRNRQYTGGGERAARVSLPSGKFIKRKPRGTDPVIVASSMSPPTSASSGGWFLPASTPQRAATRLPTMHPPPVIRPNSSLPLVS